MTQEPAAIHLTTIGTDIRGAVLNAGLASSARGLARSRHTVAVLVLFLIVQGVLLGPLLWGAGLPKGFDMNASLLAGYAAENDSWGQLWDDSRSPGSPKHITRLTSTELVLDWMTEVTGNVEASTRVMAWLVRTLAALAMYAFMVGVTRSRTGGVVAGLVYVFASGAGLYAGLPFAAGYALIPVWLLALDRLLVRPRPMIGVVFGTVTGIFVTATLPGFTYPVMLMGLVYVVAFAATRAATSTDLRQTRSELLYVGRTILLAAVIASLFAAYFIFALFLSTGPLLDAAGGYELVDIATRLPEFSDAAALKPVGFTQGPSWLDVTTNSMIVFVALTAAIAINFRVGAFLFIYIGAVLFASDVTTPAYSFLFENLPYFSLVRGAIRWIAIATLAVAFLAGTATMLAVSGRAAAADVVKERWWSTIVPGVLVLAWGSVVSVLLFLGAHTSAMREWYGPYTVDPALIDSFEYIDGLEGNPAFATSPFLETRLTGEPFITAIDFGRTLGPGSTGSTAFGGLRAGGLDINQNAGRITGHLVTPAVDHGDLDIFPGPLTEMFVAANNFQMLATLPLTGEDGERLTSSLVLQFRDRGQNEQIELRINRVDGLVALVAGPEGTQPVGTVRFDGSQPALLLDIRKIGSRFRVDLGGDDVTEVATPSLGSTSLLATSSSGIIELNDVEVATLEPSGPASDEVMVRLLDLYRIKYYLVQPHSSRIEAGRIASIENLEPVESWPRTDLYRVRGSHDRHAYLTDEYGMYIGDPGVMVPALYQAIPLADSLTPMIGLDDAGLLGSALEDSMFLGIPNPSSATDTASIAGIAGESERPPFVIVPTSTNDLQDELGSPYSLPTTLFVRDPAQIWRTSRTYAFQARVAAAVDDYAAAALEFLHTSISGQPVETVRIEPSTGQVSITVRSGQDERATTANFGPLNDGFVVRLVQRAGLLTVFIDGVAAASISTSPQAAVGPLLARATGAGFVLSELALATNREGDAFLEQVALNGFSIAGFVQSGTPPARDVVNLFSALSGQSITLRALPAGELRVLAHVETVSDGVVSSSVTSAQETEFLEMGPVRGETGPVEGWFLSSPFTANPAATTNLRVFTQGQETRISTVLLVEERSPGGGVALAGAMLAPREFRRASLEKQSSTAFEGELEPGTAALLVFRDSYDEGWRLNAGGGEWEDVRVFGSLSGFWVPDDAGPGPIDASISFRPQSAFFWGKLLSALTILGLVIYGGWWRRKHRVSAG